MANECWWQPHKSRSTDISCCNKNSARSETTRASLNLDIWWSSFVQQLNFREEFSILCHWSNFVDLLLTKEKTTRTECLSNSSYPGDYTELVVLCSCSFAYFIDSGGNIKICNFHIARLSYTLQRLFSLFFMICQFSHYLKRQFDCLNARKVS